MSDPRSSSRAIEQPSTPRKPKRRTLKRILSYILPSRLFRSRGRLRTRHVSYPRHAAVASSTPSFQSAGTPSCDQRSSHELERRLPGLIISRRNSVNSQINHARLRPLPQDDGPQHGGLAAESIISRPATLPSPSSHPSPLGATVFTPSCVPTASHYIETGQTTPLSLDNDTCDIPNANSKSTDIVPIARHTSEEKNPFVVTAYIIDADGNKGGILMSIDTQSSWSLLSLERWRRSGLKIEPSGATILLPLQTAASPVGRIKPHGIVKDVDWHIARGMQTNTSNFLVVDMKHYDAVLGQFDIKRYEVLKPGRGLERRTVERNLT